MRKTFVVKSSLPKVLIFLQLLEQSHERDGPMPAKDALIYTLDLLLDGPREVTLSKAKRAARCLMRGLPTDSHYGSVLYIGASYSPRFWNVIRLLAMALDNEGRGLSTVTPMADAAIQMLRAVYSEENLV